VNIVERELVLLFSG